MVIDERKDTMPGVMRQVQPKREATEAADAIREAHHDAMKTIVPASRICRHSVPFWDKEISALHNEGMRAKEACGGHRSTRGIIPQVVERVFRTTYNMFKCRIKGKGFTSISRGMT